MVLAVLCTGCEMMGGFATKADNVVANATESPESRIKRAWMQATPSCAITPPAEMTLSDPICVSLMVRGREMECIARRIRDEGLKNHYASRNGLLNWEICVQDIARTLADGYYLATREIERRVQLCDVLLEASPAVPQHGLLHRLVSLSAEPEVARPTPSEYGVAARPVPTGVLKCEVLLPKKPLPIEVTPVVSEPVVEAPTPAPEVIKQEKPPTSEPAKKRSKSRKAPSSGKSAGPKASVPMGDEKAGDGPGGEIKDAGRRGKQT
jgi:hypothetical protein